MALRQRGCEQSITQTREYGYVSEVWCVSMLLNAVLKDLRQWASDQAGTDHPINLDCRRLFQSRKTPNGVDRTNVLRMSVQAFLTSPACWYVSVRWSHQGVAWESLSTPTLRRVIGFISQRSGGRSTEHSRSSHMMTSNKPHYLPASVGVSGY